MYLRNGIYVCTYLDMLVEIVTLVILDRLCVVKKHHVNKLVVKFCMY
jgi:hypothetical protein